MVEFLISQVHYFGILGQQINCYVSYLQFPLLIPRPHSAIRQNLPLSVHPHSKREHFFYLHSYSLKLNNLIPEANFIPLSQSH